MSTVLQAEKTVPPVAADQLIVQQIRKASAGLKFVDLVTSLVALAAGVLGYLLLAIVFDQWVVSGGLGGFGRWLLLLGLLAGAGYFLARQIVPLLIRQLNPAFAARELERGAPGLKNSLINFIFFRQDPRGISAPVYQAIEQQAAQQLRASAAELAIDQSKVIRVGYFFLAAVVLAALYQVLSPKSPWQTVSRVLAPWADILPASRVAISDIRPGKDLEVVRGERLPISARIQGMTAGEEAAIVFTTDNAQTGERRIAMTRAASDSNVFHGWLPEEESGVSQPLNYRLEAGDARSHSYKVRVIAAPTMWVESVVYEYPDYTGYSTRKVARQGDLEAIEGTIVTVTARTNHVIASASIDFDCDGVGDKAMRYEGTKATVRFPLALAADRRTPLHASYCLRFTNREDRQNREPARHLIAVTPDLPPEIEFLAPEAKTIEVPLDGQVELELNAKDPDFLLADVELAGELQGRRAVSKHLLAKPTIGQFGQKYTFRPGREGLKAGDRLTYWAIARDNKTPQAGETSTETRLLIVTGPRQPGELEKQADEADKQPNDEPSPDGSEANEEKHGDEGKQENGDQGDDQSKSDSENSEQGDQSEGSDGAQGGLPDSGGSKGDTQGQDQSGTGGKPGEQSGEKSETENDGGEGDGSGEPIASDGTQDGDAFDRIQEHLKSQSQDSLPPDQGDKKPSPDSQQAEGDAQGEAGGKGNPDEAAGNKGQGEGDSTQEKPQGSGNEGQTKSDQGEGGEQGDAKPADKSQGQQTGEDKPDEAEGGQGEGDAAREAGKPQSADGAGEKADDTADKGGDPQHDKGEAGAGKKSNDSSGAPSPENDAEQNNNKQTPQNAQQPPNEQDQPKSPGHGKRESDSQGDQSGDKQGGGEEGGGQSSKQPGTGGAGQNTASEQGGSQAEESGQGETSDRPGDDTESASPTGKSAQNKPGPGSKSGEGQSTAGKKNSGDEGTGESAGEQSGDTAPPKPGSQGETPGAGERTGGTAGGSEANNAAPPQPGDFGEAIGGDDPNLEYAKQATDLVLKRLQDDMQKNQVDQKLLDKLGWSEDELRQFMARWQKLKQAARADGNEAQGELEQTLRSLGLRKGNIQQKRRVSPDDLRNLREAHRSPAPPEYAERLKAYQKGLSSGTSSPKASP